MLRSAVLATLLFTVSLSAASAPAVESLAVGKTPVHAVADVASGRLFVANGGNRGGEGASISMVEPGGRVATIAVAESPAHIAVSAAHHKAVVLHPSGNYATLIDTQTMQTRTVFTGINPSRTFVAEASPFAYVIGRGATPGSGSGSVTEIDLRSGFARIYPVAGFGPETGVLNAAGTRLFLIGTNHARGGEWLMGYVQAFDLSTKSTEGAPIPLGRMPRHVLASAGGDEVYVVGHVDHVRANLPQDDARRSSLRPALFVLDDATLALKRTALLPDTRELDLRGPLLIGRAELAPENGNVYVLDSLNERLAIVHPHTGVVESIELEAPGMALAVNPVTHNLLVSFNTVGTAGVFSLGGERLDTLAIGRAANAGEASTQYQITVNAATGNAYVTHGHEGTVAVLRRPADAAAVVNFTDLWVSPAQPGWGLFLDQQGATAFGTLFTHDAAGQPTWYFMSNGQRQADGSFAGELFRTKGPLREAPRNVVAVGILRFEPGAGSSATLIYYVDGMLNRRSVQRFRFDESPRDCRWTVGAPKALSNRSNFTALWSNPADPGWGLAVSHQGDSTFGVLFTYDAENRPTWAVMSHGERNAAGNFSGEVYRAVGLRIERAGTMSMAFSSVDAGVLSYRMGGLDFKGPIIRQAYSRLTTQCFN